MRGLVFIVLACALDACVPRAKATPAPTSVTVTSAPIEMPSPTTESGTSCRLTVTDTEGCTEEDVEKLVERSRPRIQACRGATGGKMIVRIREADGQITFRVQPGSSLDPYEQQCVLDALVIVTEPDVVSGYKGGISVPPSGFTALLTIEF